MGKIIPKNFNYLLIIITLFALYECKRIPVIAIVANSFPLNSDSAEQSRVNYQYVRWIEQSLADIMVIHPWNTEKEITKILTKVNAVVLPGGDRLTHLGGELENTIKFILKSVIEIYDNSGKKIPLWGTCQGFQLLHALLVDDFKVFGTFNAEEIIQPIIFNNLTIHTSAMFKDFSPQDLENIQTKDVTAQWHHFGIGPDEYLKYPALNNFFKITSYGKDLDGKIFINSVEAYNYPIYAVQFHPEMVSYTKYERKGVPTSKEAVKIAQLFSNFLVEVASLNDNEMTVKDYKKYDMINSFSTTPLEDNGWFYYEFNKKSSNLHKKIHIKKIRKKFNF